MNSIRILDWSGASREVRFVGWNKAHTTLFIYEGQYVRRAINLVLPSLFNLQFRENPFSNVPPKEIVRTALHLPPLLCLKGGSRCLADRRCTSQEISSGAGPAQCRPFCSGAFSSGDVLAAGAAPPVLPD
jgi:hypothetical protein